MVIFPNAKINIGLNIINKRPDGFHNIETIFYPIPLYDVLEIIPLSEKGDKAVMKLYGLPVDGDVQRNLCVQAYSLLNKEYDLPPVKIVLQKAIPMGAGLGGGSADGANTLVLLNKLFQIGLNAEQLKNYASMLGSDCAFFIDNSVAFGAERGDKLNDILLDLNGYYLILVKPDVHIGTKEAYLGVKLNKPLHSLKEIINLPINEWKGKLVNDFEESVFLKFQDIKVIKDELYKNGALYASMTGSGSSVYGIFDSKKDLKDRFNGMFYWEGFL